MRFQNKSNNANNNNNNNKMSEEINKFMLAVGEGANRQRPDNGSKQTG